MAFFQNTVTEKYLNSIDKQTIHNKFLQFKEHFHNPQIQQNIRNSKEEQYQEGFLRDLFVKILGYTLNPQHNFNLTTEYKNIKDSKKADGAIIINEKVLAVIELKGTDTTDLGKIETQAFGYKNNQPECIYIITSNFEKLRLYIDNAIEHLEFNLFTLTEKQFELLYLCLAFENIEKGVAKKIKAESISQEDTITKKLYNDYSLFKRELHQNLVQLNPEFHELDLFKKSQKLLDRFLFLFFAEDRQLLPPNSVRLILNDWRELQERDAEIPLFNRFRKYFGYLNTGFKGKRYDVFAYNGGLFKPDEILDVVKIDDELLFKHALKLSEYNFASEVDVNILGHIFENSLNELEEIKAQLEGQVIDKSKSKRKKDGVFYTPKYITKYIVENTIGKLCSEKKEELQIVEEDYTSDNRIQKRTKQAHFEKLKTYREWLLQLTICDPACGSGAFLNQALDFLIAEHRYIEELQAKLFGDSFVLSDVEKSILENNIFGVDLNEESVEIAKLSLWLRTAQPNRTLNNLNNNIKCGNSLIDDPAIAGDKAFNWQQAFPHVFEKGGFDVVIGNPPYVVLTPNDFKSYNYTKGNNNTYIAFIELGLIIINKNGELGFIIPNTWFGGDNFVEIRDYIIKNKNLKQIIQLPYDIFQAYIDTSIILLNNHQENKYTEFYRYDIKEFQNNIDFKKLEKFPNQFWLKYGKIFLNNELLKIGEKVWFSPKNILLGEISKINRGSLPPKENEKAFEKSNFHNIKWFDNQVFRYKEEINKEVFVNYESLRENKSIEVYKGKRIFGRQLMSRNFRMNLTLIEYDCAFKKNIYVIYDLNKNFSYEFILCVLNSKLFSFTQVNFNTSLQRDDFPAFSLRDFKNFSIPLITLESQYIFIKKADLMLSLHKELQEATQKFQRAIQRKFEIEELSTKLQNWYTITYKEFIAELGKKRIKLTLAQEAEWEEYFLQEQTKAMAIKNQIDTTDKEIDQMVYDLYELTPEEIVIIEKGV
ncbi:MAG: restriction endonuclease subunit M [Bacteroidetes bacterium HGW-Bacteroidetes-20]|nr:MAG: restriction endonuclease subunit M [Bacteroidetes bacterium HGW-Bacteroidetes-20]